jgi:3-deoxy-D-arabino-heptulosonate 7-phosphate (DAHP) synthase
MARERDIEKAREELQEAKREAADRVRALEEEALVAKLAAEQYGQQMAILKGDALKFQATARAAHGSYERELQLHAKAERDLKDMETGTDMFTCLHFLLPTAPHCALHCPTLDLYFYCSCSCVIT